MLAVVALVIVGTDEEPPVTVKATTWLVWPETLEATASKTYAPAAGGVPEMMPLTESTESQPGRLLAP